MQFQLNRFIEAQEECFDTVRNELINKKKKTHWIWFIFPQLKGLGVSYFSNFYGISNLEEAREYYKNKYLRKNLNELTDIILNYKNIDLLDVFGNTDLLKFRSCMTLFYKATKENRFKNVISKYFDGIFDENTIKMLKNML